MSEIGKRSIFKICGRCFGDSLCYKREIVYERLRYSIFMTWIANSVDRKFPANLACDRSECIGSSARMGHKYQSCSSRLLFLIEIDYPIVHACPPRSEPTKRLQEKASQSRVPAEQAQGKSWERQASLRSFRRTQQAPCQRQSVPCLLRRFCYAVPRAAATPFRGWPIRADAATVRPTRGARAPLLA